MGLRSFVGSFFAALYGLYALRELHLMPAQLGFLIACGGIGALAGTAALQWLIRRFALGYLLTSSLLISAIINLLVPLAAFTATPQIAMLILIAVQIIGDAAMTVYTVQEMTLRQSVVDERLLGRANASFGFLAECTPPVGGLVAGALGTLIGTTGALAVACVGFLVVAVYTLCSPARLAMQPVDSES
jgi:hypothetical protein